MPNVFLTFARRPEEFRAFFAYHDALMERAESRLTKGEMEMIVTATSAVNHCLYCVVAHGAVLRIREKSNVISDQIATNYRKADISDRQRAMLDFAVKLAGSGSSEVNEEDFATLNAHGFDDETIWDIAAITAFFVLSNRMANATGMLPNTEFYTIGRGF